MKQMIRVIPLVLGAGLLFAIPAQARNYDCSKAGNANKAACKTPVAAPASTPTKSTTTTTRHYDCTKAGNANKAACKGSAAITATQAAPLPPPPPAHTTSTTATTTHTVASTTTNAGAPSGATAKCKDGTYSHSATHSGTCSHHGGVATWY